MIYNVYHMNGGGLTAPMGPHPDRETSDQGADMRTYLLGPKCGLAYRIRVNPKPEARQ